MSNPFVKASKHQLKARVAFAGPTGSGKTYSALEWATILAEGGTIAVVDTEHGSASLYADQFDFDVLTWAPPYDPGKLAETIVTAEKAGYAVLVLDSMSHFWEGEGGTIDIADAAGQRSGGNSFAGWKVATPALRHLIDTMLGCDMHVIGTMRSKMEYVLEQNERGRNVPKKVGMAPVMRQGVEYEFTMVGDIDLEHRITFTKSRCSALADVMVQPGRAKDSAETFLAWLQSGEPDPVHDARERLTADLKALPEAQRSAIAAWIKDKFLPAVARMSMAEIVSVRDELARQASGPDGPGVADPEHSTGDADPLAAEGSGAVAGTPEPDAAKPEREGPAPTQTMTRKLFALLKEHDIEEDDRHAWAGVVLGREIASFSTLSRVDVAKLIDALEAERA